MKSLMSALVSIALCVSAALAYEPVKPEEVDSGLPYNVAEIPAADPTALAGRRVALLAAHGFEEIEATYPIRHLTARGARVDVITPDWITGRVMAVQFLKPSIWVPVTARISDAKVEDYDAVVVPGGAWNPIIMRTDAKVLDFLRAANQRGLLIASVCHGPQVLINAGLVKGKTLTGVADIRADLRNAGGKVVEDQPAVIDGNLITSRDPNDMAQFAQAIETALKARARSTRFSALYATSGTTSICTTCNGTGVAHGGPGYYPYRCSQCEGTGRISTHQPPVSTDH